MGRPVRRSAALSQHRIDEPTYQGRLALGVYEILKAYEQPLKENAARLALANGIRLDGLVDDQERIDLAKLLVGSQGTLGSSLKHGAHRADRSSPRSLFAVL